VQNPINFDGSYGRALQSGEEHAAKGIPQGMTKTPFQGLNYEFAISCAERGLVNFYALRHLEIYSVHSAFF
jgi:hypothetical protein